MSLYKNQGFTLIELLVALAVFAILATLTSSSMYYAFETKTRLAKQMNRLTAIELAIMQVERDSQQIVLRNVRGNNMQVFSAFVGESQYLEFTRGGFSNPGSNEKRSNLQRVALLCQGNKLLRRTWLTLDTTNRKRYQDKILVNNLASCNFSYLNQSLQTLNEWRANALQQNQKAEPLPKAFQMNLTLTDWGNMNYLFVIPEALYADTTEG